MGRDCPVATWVLAALPPPHRYLEPQVGGVWACSLALGGGDGCFPVVGGGQGWRPGPGCVGTLCSVLVGLGVSGRATLSGPGADRWAGGGMHPCTLWACGTVCPMVLACMTTSFVHVWVLGPWEVLTGAGPHRSISCCRCRCWWWSSWTRAPPSW